MADPIQSLLQRANEVAVSLCETPAATYGDYMKRVGEYIGLKEAANLLLDKQREDDART